LGYFPQRELIIKLSLEFAEILTSQALGFIANLQGIFGKRRNDILQKEKNDNLKLMRKKA